MTSQPENKQERGVSESDSVMSLITSMADTTWRMFVPPALFVSGGLYIDLHYKTKPWMTILGAVVGLAVAILLVRQQLRRS